MEENGVQRARRRLEEQGSPGQEARIFGTNQVGDTAISQRENVATLETIDPNEFRQGLLEKISSSYRATEEMYQKALTELDNKRLEAQKDLAFEFNRVLDEWQQQVASMEDNPQRTAMEETLMSCRRSLLFSHAAEKNRSSDMMQQHETHYRADEARFSSSPMVDGVVSPTAKNKLKEDWDDFTNREEVHSYRSLDSSKSALVVFETIAPRYGTREYLPDVLKANQGSVLASEVLRHITKPGKIADILASSEHFEHPLANAIREVMERMTSGKLKQQEIHDLCRNEIDVFELSKKLEVDVAGIRAELQKEALVVKKANPFAQFLNALGGRSPEVEPALKLARIESANQLPQIEKTRGKPEQAVAVSVQKEVEEAPGF